MTRMKLLILTLASQLVAHAAFAADQHLTLRLEDGLPAGRHTLPVTIVVPITAGKGGAGAALAPFYEYGPHTIDGSGLQVAGDRITGTLSGKRRTGSALPVWTLDATIKDGRVTGMATAPAAGRVPAVTSRVAGYVDAPAGGAWMIECGMPWTDRGSHAKLAADGGNYHVATIVRLRLDPKGGKVVYVADGRTIQAEKFQGSPESFTADITCLAKDDKTPIQINLKGGRIGRGGIVEATIQSAAGHGKGWKGAATVWAWPDAPGFTGGREQDLEKWQHTAQPDPALVEAAVKEAATPIHPVEPGTGEVWQHHSMQRDVPRCTAPPTFDIRPLPVAARYRLSVTRIVGKPMTLMDEEVTDPFAALAAVWGKPGLGKFRFQFLVDGKPATAMDVWLREKQGTLWGGRQPACPSWLTPVMQGDSYRVRVHKAKDKAAPMEFTVKQPWAPLTEVWAKLAPGGYRLEIQGIGADGKELGARPWSTGFEKVATFHGPYFSGPARPYKDAALALARWTSDHPTLGSLRGHRITIPPGQGDNGDSQILTGAISTGLVRYRLATDPNEREAGLMMAIETGDHMRAGCTSRDGMPKCYKGGIANTHLFGTAFLDLYAATGDPRWKDAAEMVARAYARTQLPNGTWAELSEDGRTCSDDPATMKSDHPVHQAAFDAGLLPGLHGPHLAEFDCSEVLWFLGRLRTELKTDAFRECEDKAYRWVMDQSVKEFFWRDQGHHSPCMVPPFKYKGRAPSYFALYLLECAPADRRDLDLAAELMRFCETRHMVWSRDARYRTTPNLVGANARESGSPIWLGSRFAMAWAQLGRLDGNRLHAEKARGIMDAVTHAQHPITGNVGLSLERTPRFNRFAVNAGRCAWHLMLYGDLLAADSKTKGSP